jgi:uncharacterized membrane protein YkoI
MKYSRWIIAYALATPMVAATAYGQEKNEESHQHQRVQMEDLPAAVRSTVQREAQGKQIESIKKETKHGRTKYEVDLISNGKGEEIEISESGMVIDREPAHEENHEHDTDESPRQPR